MFIPSRLSAHSAGCRSAVFRRTTLIFFWPLCKSRIPTLPIDQRPKCCEWIVGALLSTGVFVDQRCVSSRAIFWIDAQWLMWWNRRSCVEELT
jgi:hypothetical protein